MDYTDKVYVDLIANAIGGCRNKVNYEQILIDRLMKLCATHRTVGLVYAGMQKTNNVPKEYQEIFEIGLNMEVTEYINNKQCAAKITEKLNDSQIKHLIIKGSTIARYYPQEELRRAGDIDLLISSADKEKVKDILLSMGAKYFYEQSDEYVDFYKIGKVPIEVHSKIVSGVKFSKNKIYENFSSNAYNSATCIENYTYEMNCTYAYVYAVFHAAKHFYKGGCGIRMIADMWLMKKSLDKDNIKEVSDILEIMGLSAFEKKVFCVGEKWFEDRNLPIDNFEYIENYIITGGLFGYGNVGGDTSQIRKQGKNYYVVSVIKWAFPGYKYMKQHSEWFKDKPRILLPIAYIVRFCKKIKNRGGKKLINNIAKGKQETDKHETMLEIMELKYE